MEKRTAEIIMVCKGRHNFGETTSHKQAVAMYMSNRCACPLEEYVDAVLDPIIFEAALDYIDGADRPSVFVRAIQDALRLHNNPLVKCPRIDYAEAICIAFSLVQARDDGCYVNGFTDEDVKPVIGV